MVQTFERDVKEMARNAFYIEDIGLPKKRLCLARPMPTELRSAIRHDIAKWLFIYRYIRDTNGLIDEDGSKTTALCGMFASSMCMGCPIYAMYKDNMIMPCHHSPYPKAYKATQGWNSMMERTTNKLERLDWIWQMILFDLSLAVIYGACTDLDEKVFIRNFLEDETK